MRIAFSRSLSIATLALVAAAMSTPASAFGLSDLNPVKIVKKSVKAVDKAASGVGKAVKSVSRDVSKTVTKASKEVAKATKPIAKAIKPIEKKVAVVTKVVAKTASTAVKDLGTSAKLVVNSPGKFIKHTGRTIEREVPKALKTTGNVVSKVYNTGAAVAEKIPLAKEFAPLARDFAKQVKKKEAQWAGAAGAGIAILSGGASHALTTAGGWAYATGKGRELSKMRGDKAKAEAERISAPIAKAAKN